MVPEKRERDAMNHTHWIRHMFTCLPVTPSILQWEREREWIGSFYLCTCDIYLGHPAFFSRRKRKKNVTNWVTFNYARVYVYVYVYINIYICDAQHSSVRGAGIAQWLEHRTRDWKVAGSNPCWNGGRIFFSRVDFLCWLLFRYPFHPRVTTVARKKSRSFCQKCRWQVTAKHAYTLRMWILLNRASALVTTCP